ncbi:MAG: hypothetical protein U9N14_04875 [Pseudomonadota bacterium]|nr:hypothetical protein [Pseudomonadota bacterium]
MWVETRPVPFQKSGIVGSANPKVPANTRQTFVSRRFTQRLYVGHIKHSFPTGTARLLELSFWLIDAITVDDDTMPFGINFLADGGGEPFVVGDGPEGTDIIEVHQDFPAGLSLAVSANNIDLANPHTVDVLFAGLKLWRDT